MVDFNRDMWVAKEFAEDYGLEWDIIIKPPYCVHINDVNAKKVFTKIYYDSLSWRHKILYKIQQTIDKLIN